MQLGVIDIGGTSIKYGVVNRNGTLMNHDSISTDAFKGGKALVEKVFMICDKLMEQYKIEGIAISSAGQIDHRNGIVVFATDTIPGYTGTPIADLVASHTGLPAAVENDVNCTALGDYWQGAAKGISDFLCVTIGTGIGGALFLNGKLYTGAHFSAGEIGHICLYPNGKPCTCGNKGCYEKYASSSALAELVETEFGTTLDLKEFFTKVKQGEAEAVTIFEHWVDDLTTGLQSLVHIFNPELIVIGGGISAQGDFLLDAIKSSLYKKIMPNHRKSLEVKLAQQDNKANLIGAAKHFLMMHGGLN
ncbi:ROK family protein [Bacillus aerolatus]|uniref:ROK family protein n=1 Tax=Bacillus aerolatus TaxID=2653354 RepID=A0A6I1FB08_9BACI|nr:ROK family protein [Bacillus aerolatus]KAB7704251.1 ROK family protein [Bacillus aerolatus]